MGNTIFGRSNIIFRSTLDVFFLNGRVLDVCLVILPLRFVQWQHYSFLWLPFHDMFCHCLFSLTVRSKLTTVP